MDVRILYVLSENVMSIGLSLEELYWRNWEVLYSSYCLHIISVCVDGLSIDMALFQFSSNYCYPFCLCFSRLISGNLLCSLMAVPSSTPNPVFSRAPSPALHGSCCPLGRPQLWHCVIAWVLGAISDFWIRFSGISHSPYTGDSWALLDAMGTVKTREAGKGSAGEKSFP